MTTTGTRWSGLDGLRALAVVAVVAYHFVPGAVPGGFLGVDVFFVLSGYLITRLLVTEYAYTARLRFGRFYLRRARRLLPGVGVLLIAGLAASAFWRDQLSTIRPATAAAAGYVSNWWLAVDHQSYFVSAGRPSMLQHLWSLAVEEQFYLVWPLVVLLVLRARGGARRPGAATRRLALVAGALALLSTGLMALLAVLDRVPYGADGSRLYYGTDTHSMGLLLGAAVGALAADRLRPRPRATRLLWASDGLAAAALAGLLALCLRAGQYDGWLYRGGFLGVAAVAVVAVWAVARRGSRLGRWLDARPLRWLGARSYAVYLWHWPVAVFTRPGTDLAWPAPLVQLLRIVVTLALADATYRIVELPIRRHGLVAVARSTGRRVVAVFAGRAPVGSRLAAAGAAGAVTLAVAVLVAGPSAPTSAAQRSIGDIHGVRALRLGTPTPTRAASPTGHRSAAATTPPASSAARSSTAPSSAAPSSARVPAPPAGPPPVSAYGDSVMLGARGPLSATFPGGTLDAVEGRQPGPILHDVLTDDRRGRLHHVVIIGVGDNGLIDPDALRSTLGALRDHRVVVVTNKVDRPWEAPNNHTIATVCRGFGNVRVLDWHARSRGHGSWFYGDGIHLTPTGAAAYARMLAALAR